MEKEREREKVEVEYDKDGTKWIYRSHLMSKDLILPARPLRPSPDFFFTTYKCNRCDRKWQTTGHSRPRDYEPCIDKICDNPSFIKVLLRSLTGQKIYGAGKRIEVKVDGWEYV